MLSAVGVVARLFGELTSATLEGNTIRGQGKGDHAPRHVHVYCEGKLVVKWDLDNWKAMKGEASPALLDLLAALVAEGVL